MGQQGMTKLLAMIDDLSIDDSFALDLKQTALILDERAQELLLTKVEMALETGDERKRKDACYRLLQTFGVSLYFQAMASIQLAMVTSITRGIRISLLMRALKIIEAMDLNTVLGHLNLLGVQIAAARFLEQLEAEELADGRTICKF
jgi:energy-converting hydrogenase Eha subunit E